MASKGFLKTNYNNYKAFIWIRNNSKKILIIQKIYLRILKNSNEVLIIYMNSYNSNEFKWIIMSSYEILRIPMISYDFTRILLGFYKENVIS